MRSTGSTARWLHNQQSRDWLTFPRGCTTSAPPPPPLLTNLRSLSIQSSRHRLSVPADATSQRSMNWSCSRNRYFRTYIVLILNVTANLGLAMFCIRESQLDEWLNGTIEIYARTYISWPRILTYLHTVLRARSTPSPTLICLIFLTNSHIHIHFVAYRRLFFSSSVKNDKIMYPFGILLKISLTPSRNLLGHVHNKLAN